MQSGLLNERDEGWALPMCLRFMYKCGFSNSWDERRSERFECCSSFSSSLPWEDLKSVMGKKAVKSAAKAPVAHLIPGAKPVTQAEFKVSDEGRSE
eukprot:538881-Hanusia_phi.AAC.2